ncbi:MAG: hypothetical protein QXY10_01225 [Candidatus Micrarchaeaceae archaeon]
MICQVCKRGILKMDTYTDELYCPVCGAIISEAVDLSMDFSEIENPHHSIISFASIDRGFADPVPRLSSHKGLKSLHVNSLLNRVERNFADSYPIFTIVFGNLHVGNEVKEEAGLLYRMCAGEGLTRGREKYAFMLSIADIVCSEMNIKRDITGFADSINVDINVVKHYEKSINKMLEIKRTPKVIMEYLKKILVGQEDIAIAKAMSTAKKLALKYEDFGKTNIKAIAAAIAYTIANDAGINKSKNEIAESVDISERSLRRALKKLERTLK